jgi:hypothetical protein
MKFKHDQIKKNYFRPGQLVVPKTRIGTETFLEHPDFYDN